MKRWGAGPKCSPRSGALLATRLCADICPAPLTVSAMIIFAAGVAASYGGELFEVIRFMEHFDEDEVAFCEDCEAEAAGIEALP